MRYSFVLLGLLAFVCYTSGYVLDDQDDAFGDTDDALRDTDDLPEANFEDNQDDALGDNEDLPEVENLAEDDVNREARHRHSNEYWIYGTPRPFTRRRRTTLITGGK